MTGYTSRKHNIFPDHAVSSTRYQGRPYKLELKTEPIYLRRRKQTLYYGKDFIYRIQTLYKGHKHITQQKEHII